VWGENGKGATLLRGQKEKKLRGKGSNTSKNTRGVIHQNQKPTRRGLEHGTMLEMKKTRKERMKTVVDGIKGSSEDHQK